MGRMSNTERKVRRALHRFYTGNGRKGRYILVTLTTPVGAGVDIHHAWRKFRLRLSRRGLNREVFAVKEYGMRNGMEHIHVVMRCAWIEQKIVRQQWSEACGVRDVNGRVRGLWIHLDKIRTPKGMANYLAKYLKKGISDDEAAVAATECKEREIIRSGQWETLTFKISPKRKRKRAVWYSSGWIMPRWNTISRHFYRMGLQLKSADYDKLVRGETTFDAYFVQLQAIYKERGWILDKVKFNNLQEAVWRWERRLKDLSEKHLTRRSSPMIYLSDSEEYEGVSNGKVGYRYGSSAYGSLYEDTEGFSFSH